MRLVLTLIVLAGILMGSGFEAFAQPHKFGCDHFRNLGPKRGPMTDWERKVLNESIARSDTFDIHHYNINIDVTDYNGHTITAATTVTYSPKLPDQQLINFDLKDLTVDSVVAPNVASYSHIGELLTVQFTEPPMLGEAYDITVYYHGIPYRDPVWGGFYFASNYIYNLGIGLSTIPPNFGRVWYPCFDSFVERATYEYHVKSAGIFRAWCQGDFSGETQLDGDTVIRSFELNLPIPTHLSAIAVSDYQNYEYSHEGAFGTVPITLRAKPAQMTAMQNVFQDLGAAIDAMEYWYGEHAWPRVGYVLTTDGALEIPTNIAYPSFMVNESITNNNFLLSHELGHHWWGDVVTPHVHNDMWMKEGPAEYSSHLHVEWMDGYDTFIDVVKDNQLFVLQNAHDDDNGFHPLSPMPDEHIYGRHTYYKGASVMHNLRGYLGDELFRLGMTTVQEAHYFEDLTPDQLKNALELATGYDLDPFFNDQIYKPGFATFVVDSFAATPNGNQWDINVFIQQKLRACPGFYTDVPLDLTVIGTDLSRQEFQVVASNEFHTAAITSDIEPWMIILNGYGKLNQNRMDYEGVVTVEDGINPNLPYVDFKLYDEVVTADSWFRIEHVWSGPDNEDLGPGIYGISSTHYWTVDGLWPEGTYFEGRVTYRGSDPIDLDYDLYGNTEADVVLLYRPNTSEPWQVYPDFTVTAGDLFNGNGSIRIDFLRTGMYAFGNGDPSVAVQEVDASATVNLNLYPVPSDEFLTVKGTGSSSGLHFLEIFDLSGKMVMRSSLSADKAFNRTLNVADLKAGQYLIRLRTPEGGYSRAESFVIAR